MTEEISQSIPVYCAHTKMVATDTLVPNPRNPNRHPAAQIGLLAKIIVTQGWRAPITVSNRSGFVVRGHGRLQAALAAGLEQVPVDYQDYESEASEWADLIADNRIAELAQIDKPTLKDLMQDLDTGVIDMDLTGYSDDEYRKLMEEMHKPKDDVTAIYPLTPKFGEKHDYVIIVVHNDTDWTWLETNLQLRQERTDKSSKVGLAHVLSIERFVELWTSR